MSDVIVCPICGETVSVNECVSLLDSHPSIGEDSGEGTIEVGWLACRECVSVPSDFPGLY